MLLSRFEVYESCPLSTNSQTFREAGQKGTCLKKESVSMISLVLHLANNFGGQAFHLFGFVREDVEQDEFSSRFGHFA